MFSKLLHVYFHVKNYKYDWLRRSWLPSALATHLKTNACLEGYWVEIDTPEQTIVNRRQASLLMNAIYMYDFHTINM